MIDCHIHYAESLGAESLLKLFRESCLDAAVLLCIPKGSGEPTEPDAFALREKSPIPLHIFGGISRKIWSAPPEEQPALLNGELNRLLAMGCAGIKLLEGKPDVGKKYKIPAFDGPVWAGFWARLEQDQIPVVFHVNDPEDFWHPERVTEVARKFGWFYDDTFPQFWDQYGQVVRVLERHPKLRILLPHFFFLSGNLQKLSNLLKEFPNLRLDITPGIELYKNLSLNIKQAREFFSEYGGRICYGTDIGARSVIRETDTPLSIGESQARMEIIRNFLERNEKFQVIPDGEYLTGDPFLLTGLGLGKEAQERLKTQNILAFLDKSK